MKNISILISLLLMSTMIFARPPDEPNPLKMNDVSWHSIRLVEYETGTLDEVKKIITKFESAAQAAGLHATSLRWFESGKYDLVVIWEFDEKPANKDWNWSPLADEWWKYFVAQEGSVEAAQQIQDRYKSMVTSTVTNIARKSK